MTDYEYIINADFNALSEGTDKDIRHNHPSLKRDKKHLISFNQTSIHQKLMIVFNGIPIVLFSNKYFNDEIPIYSFYMGDGLIIHYLVDLSTTEDKYTTFKNIIDILQGKREELLSSLMVVSKYFQEEESIYRKRINFSDHFSDLVDVYHELSEKPNNYQELLGIFSGLMYNRISYKDLWKVPEDCIMFWRLGITDHKCFI